MRHTSVYHQYLPMILSFIITESMGLYGLKRLVCIPMLSISFIKCGGMAFNAAKIIIYDSHHNSMLYLFFEYIKYLIKHNATADYEILQ